MDNAYQITILGVAESGINRMNPMWFGWMSLAYVAETLCRANDPEFKKFTIIYEACDFDIPDILQVSSKSYTNLKASEKTELNKKQLEISWKHSRERITIEDSVDKNYGRVTETPVLNGLVKRKKAYYHAEVTIMYKIRSLFRSTDQNVVTLLTETWDDFLCLRTFTEYQLQ